MGFFMLLEISGAGLAIGLCQHDSKPSFTAQAVNLPRSHNMYCKCLAMIAFINIQTRRYKGLAEINCSGKVSGAMSSVPRMRHRTKTPDPHTSPPDGKGLQKAESLLKNRKDQKGVSRPVRRALSFDSKVAVVPITSENPAPVKAKSSRPPAKMSEEEADRILKSIPVHRLGSFCVWHLYTTYVGINLLRFARGQVISCFRQ